MVVDLKETTVKSIGNAKSMQVQSAHVSADLYNKIINTKATMRHSTTSVRYLLTFPISNVS